MPCALHRKDGASNLALPAQTLMNFMALLGKKNGGSRAIAIMGTFYRVLMKMLGQDVAEWVQEEAGHWDTAIRRCSALRAHLARALDIELADIEGAAAVVIPWDMEKLFDSVRISKLR